jgi:hypothetical protein
MRLPPALTADCKQKTVKQRKSRPFKKSFGGGRHSRDTKSHCAGGKLRVYEWDFDWRQISASFLTRYLAPRMCSIHRFTKHAHRQLTCQIEMKASLK